MKIGLLSDSHAYIDEKIIKHLSTCDEIWHAGDIGDIEVTEQLKKVKPLIGVYGNIDNHTIRQEFPEHQIFEREGLKIWITHIGGYPGRYPTRIKTIMEKELPDIFICGHSHILKVMRDDKFKHIHMNPGACGKHGFHKMRTMIRFDIEAKKISNLEVIELGKRGAIE